MEITLSIREVPAAFAPEVDSPLGSELVDIVRVLRELKAPEDAVMEAVLSRVGVNDPQSTLRRTR